MARFSKIFTISLFIFLFNTGIHAAMLSGISEGKPFEISIGEGFSDSIHGNWGNTRYEITFGGFLSQTIKGKIEVVDSEKVELIDTKKIDVTVSLTQVQGTLPCGKVNFKHEIGFIYDGKFSGILCGENFELDLSRALNSEVQTIDFVIDEIVDLFPRPAAATLRHYFYYILKAD